MKQFTPVEWQFFPLKKDIEGISKKVNEAQGYQITFYCEVALLIFGVAFQYILDDNLLKQKIWTSIAIISAIIFIVPPLVFFIKKKRRQKSRETKMPVKEFIDSFDNEVCYHVLMAESYLSMFQSSIKNDKTEKNIDQFYYIETCYYLNKAVNELSPIFNISTKVLAKTATEVNQNGMIAYTRFANVCEMILKIYSKISCYSSLVKDLHFGNIITDSNTEIYNTIKDLQDIVKEAEKKSNI